MNRHRFISIGLIFAITALACNLPFSSQGEGLNRETEVALTLTAADRTETGQPTITEEATATFTSEPTLTTTSTSTPTFTSTFTALPPTSTFTPSPTPTATDTPLVIILVNPVLKGKISGFVFFDNNLNGVYNFESGELPAQSATARIMNGACPGEDIVFQASSKANGVFETIDLNLGTYCVLVLPNGVKWGGNFVPTTSNQRTMEVTLNNTVNAGIFGFRKQ